MAASPLIVAGLIVAVYTGNYALEVWREGNRFGGGVLLLLAVLAAALPSVVIFLR